MVRCCEIGPQDPGGGAAGVIEVTNSPELSVVEPQVPSRILVVLVEVLPLPMAQPQESVSSPVSTGPVSLRQASSAELVGESPRRTRRAKWWIRPVRVMTGSVGDLPILTIQDPSDVQGAMVYDCRPPLLLCRCN